MENFLVLINKSMSSNKQTELKKVFDFLDLLQKFRQVERVIYACRNSERKESDVEHSWQLTMLAWFIIDQDKLNLDLDKVIKYALVHDLVEAYAGDTWAFKGSKDDKVAREEESLNKIKEEFSDFKELLKTIEDYNNQVDNESVFVYALDKLEPIFHNYLDGGRIWRDTGISLEHIKDYKREKIAKCPELVPYFESLIRLLEENKERIFDLRKE